MWRWICAVCLLGCVIVTASDKSHRAVPSDAIEMDKGAVQNKPSQNGLGEMDKGAIENELGGRRRRRRAVRRRRAPVKTPAPTAAAETPNTAQCKQALPGQPAGAMNCHFGGPNGGLPRGFCGRFKPDEMRQWFDGTREKMPGSDYSYEACGLTGSSSVSFPCPGARASCN